MTSATLVVRARQGTARKRRHVFTAWLIAWLGAPVIGVVNGAARAVYEGRVGTTAAHYVATTVLMVLLGIYMRLLANTGLFRRGAPPRSSGQHGPC